MKFEPSRIAVSIFIFVLLSELALHLSVDLWTKNLTINNNPTDYRLSNEQLSSAKKIFDPELGWKRSSGTKFGERKMPTKYGHPLLVTFGDSFVFGDEVSDSETWPAQLADLFQRDVYNLGESGYGTDQAYLRFKKFASQVKTPYVSMGITIENINRLVNIYRKFYYPNTGLPLTKPRAILQGNVLKFIDNPIQSIDDLIKLQDLEFIQALGAQDIWYTFRKKTYALQTPYILNLFNPQFWQEILTPIFGEVSSDIHLWTNDEAVRIMAALVGQFSADVRAQGAQPIITILPRRQDIEAIRNGSIYQQSVLRKICSDMKLSCFDGIEFMDKELAAKA